MWISVLSVCQAPQHVDFTYKPQLYVHSTLSLLFNSSPDICLHSKCFVTIIKYLKEAKMIRKWVYLVW